MHIHILGICGTFMGSLALLARELGHRVTGSDANVYPPMSTQLERAGIALWEGYDPAQLEPVPDLVIIGNAMTRGNPCVEAVLERGLKYTSGPQWLHDEVLQERWVLAVAGTHGKTTTASMLAWVLEYANLTPGFMIGGAPNNFEYSARLGNTPFFVIEADEYDTAFFDKRSKFVHYCPRTLVLNNLEFDHADIFPDLASIQRQFHHLIRTVPSGGQVILPAGDVALETVMEMGCWSEVLRSGDGSNWRARLIQDDGSEFAVLQNDREVARIRWSLTGAHNVSNGLHALLAARHVGVTPEHSAAALSGFGGVKRRMELLGQADGVWVYDDFAHHPTAIATTLQGLRARIGDAPLVAVIEPRSNTMRLGSHRDALAPSTAGADRVFWYQPADLDWSLDSVVAQSIVPASLVRDIDQLVQMLVDEVAPGAHLVIMSNGGFGGIHGKLIERLEKRGSHGGAV